MNYNRKLKISRLNDISGGININDEAISIAENQAVSIENLIIKGTSIVRFPGVKNITSPGDIASVFRGLISHVDSSGDDHLFTVYGGKLYEINKSTGAVSAALYDMTGSGEVESDQYNGVLFLTNGSKVVKVETSTAYQVGIAAPTTGSAAALAGGALSDGVYGIYICYGRKVSGSNVLYSSGNYLGTVTLGSGNNSVRISSFGNSSDSQVNNKIVFMTDAGGASYYFYHETSDNTTTTVDITSTAQRDTSQDYLIDAYDNNPPGAFEHLHIFGKKLYGSIGNILYHSIKSQNIYDLEKFPTEYFKEYPYKITGIFSLGKNLYLNTDYGILRQPEGDISLEYESVTKGIYFKYMNTVSDWGGFKIGLTNFGVRLFDGEKILEYNLSKNISPDIDKMYNVDGNYNFKPFGIVFRRNIRTEYLLSFRDTTLGTLNNNKTYILNLDKFVVIDNINFSAPWELVTHGFNYASISSDNVLYMAQSYANASVVYKETSTNTYEEGIYSSAGVYLSSPTAKRIYIKSRVIFENQFTLLIPSEIRSLIFFTTQGQLLLKCYEEQTVYTSGSLDISTGALWDSAVWDVDVWAAESPYFKKTPAKDGMASYGLFWEVNQTANDITFKIEGLELEYQSETGRQQ